MARPAAVVVEGTLGGGGRGPQAAGARGTRSCWRSLGRRFPESVDSAAAESGSGTPLDVLSAEAAVAVGEARPIRSLDDVRDYVYGFFGQEKLLLRRVDLTTVAAQSGLLGAAVTAAVFMLAVRQR